MTPGSENECAGLVVKWEIFDSYCACAAGGGRSVPRAFPVMLYDNPGVDTLVDTCVIRSSVKEIVYALCV
jgi:hypothetical protein